MSKDPGGRGGQWKGLFSRLSWSKVAEKIVTNPENQRRARKLVEEKSKALAEKVKKVLAKNRVGTVIVEGITVVGKGVRVGAQGAASALGKNSMGGAVFGVVEASNALVLGCVVVAGAGVLGVVYVTRRS